MIHYIILFALTIFLLGCQSLQNEQKSEDLGLARTALSTGHPENALAIYKDKLKQEPYNSELLFLAGMACNQSGRYDEALHYLDKGYQITPSQEFERELGSFYISVFDEHAPGRSQHGLTNEEQEQYVR